MSVLAFPAGPIITGERPARHLTVVPALPSEHQAIGREVHGSATRRTGSAAATAAAEVPMRLTARGRRVVVALVVALVVAMAALLGSLAGVVVGVSTGLPTDVETMTVAPGESLWTIASAITEPGADVRDAMAEIAALNDLDGSALVAGQTLTIPSGG